MKLKKKIQNSMILVVLTSLILTYGTMIFVVYYQTMEILKDEIQQEADYIEAAVCISGYLIWKIWMQFAKIRE